MFAAAFFEVIFPPIPSEVVFPLVGFTAQKKGLGLENVLGLATTGALGSTARAVLIYFVSMEVGRAAIVWFGKRLRVSEQEVEKAEKWFAKYGPAAVFHCQNDPRNPRNYFNSRRYRRMVCHAQEGTCKKQRLDSFHDKAEQRLLRVQPVFSLWPYNRRPAVNYVGRNFLAALCRETVQEYRVFFRELHDF